MTDFTPASEDKALTKSEWQEATQIYNQDKTPLLIPLASGRLAIFSRRMDFICVRDEVPNEIQELFSNLEQILALAKRLNIRHESNDREFARALRAARIAEDEAQAPSFALRSPRRVAKPLLDL